jgi:hypothetical protein
LKSLDRQIFKIMRHLKAFLYLCIIVLLLQFCKSSDPAPVTPVGTPEITEQGTPFGDVASASIGSAGGTITSADGLVTLDVPVGALDANTTISIQPITNTAPLGVSGMAYRFSPDGQIFKKPAKLTFNYTPDLMDSTSAEFLWIVTQDKDGSWLALTNSNVDTVARTLSGEISHFSDWGAGKAIDLKLDPSSTLILPSESVKIYVDGFFYEAPTIDGLRRLIHNISEKSPYKLASKKGNVIFKTINWSLSGDGTLKAGGSGYTATYTAPGEIPSVNPVTVSLELESSDYATGKHLKNITLKSKITIVDKGILVVNFNGKRYSFKQFENGESIVFVTEGAIALIGPIEPLGPYFSISRVGTNIGTHVHNCMINDDDAQYVDANLETVFSLQWCRPNNDDLNTCTKVCNHFISNITKFGKPGEIVEGNFSGNLYNQKNGASVPITGYFKLLRTG